MKNSFVNLFPVWLSFSIISISNEKRFCKRKRQGSAKTSLFIFYLNKPENEFCRMIKKKRIINKTLVNLDFKKDRKSVV